ncbi:Ribonuclease H2 subunit A [Chionoecetes opilio]|uniref:Ribonuclease n=1 Tax=Chionoecetes opilio TaxID=41210 RepID=A0A8J5CXW5_CHIOP|nr:Ribonuclease H2 subunit A [Chionoecetes opilio]
MDVTTYTQSNCKNAFVDSSIPDVCLKEPCVVGVDEAGRGPVLGPMVYGICFCPVTRHEDLKKAGVADSKTLKKEAREEIFDIIDSKNDFIGWALEIISPVFITTNSFARPKVSLNEVSHNSAIGLIKRAIAAGVQVSEVYVDTVGRPEKYQAKLEQVFPTLKVTVAIKADSKFPCVSGASICAKVARDKALAEWEFPEGTEILTDWGSGYPNDDKAKNFLQNSLDPIFGFPDIVRFSWDTAVKLIEKKCVTMSWNENDEEQENKTPSILEYYAKSVKRKSSDNDPPPPAVLKKHFFFSERSLSNSTDF